MRYWSRGGIAAVCVALLGLAGCGEPEDSTYLPALKADPMAVWMPTGVEKATRSFYKTYDPGTTFGTASQRPASVLRVFTLSDATAAAAATTEGLRAAGKAGWNPNQFNKNEFSKPMVDSTAQLGILQSTDNPQEITVSLELTP